MEGQRRAADQVPNHRANDEVWTPEAEVSSHKMLYAMHHSIANLERRLTDHMATEERAGAIIDKKLSDIAEAIKMIAPLMDSMPRDEHGSPSTFLHRVQHETQSLVYRSGFLWDLIKFLAIILVVLGATGSFNRLILKLLGP